MTTESSINTCAYPLANQTLNPILTLTETIQQAVVSIKLNIVTCPTYPEKFARDNVVAPFVQLSVVIVTLPVFRNDLQLCRGRGIVKHPVFG